MIIYLSQIQLQPLVKIISLQTKLILSQLHMQFQLHYQMVQLPFFKVMMVLELYVKTSVAQMKIM